MHSPQLPPQLREEKIELENALEAESEAHVNRLSREISALRLAQQQTVNGGGSTSGSPVDVRGSFLTSTSLNPQHPNTEAMLEALRRENENLRNRLVDTERDYVRLTRLNEVYREELIDHRRRVSAHLIFYFFIRLVKQCLTFQSLFEAWSACRQLNRPCTIRGRSLLSTPPFA